MAPYKTLSKKEQSLQQRPWISGDILNEMHIRDQNLKNFMSEKKCCKKGKLIFSVQEKEK